MILFLEIDVKERRLSLPLAHHHILQSIFYNLMPEKAGETHLHNKGYSFEKRDYKLFTFGPIQGHYVVSGKNIVFTDKCTLQFRSTDKELVSLMAQNVSANGIRFGNTVYDEVVVKTVDENDFPDTSEATIKMVSPICVYETDLNKKTHFYNPGDDEFYYSVIQNFRRKYEAAYGEAPLADITLSPYRISPKDKYITQYKNFYIEAYKGRYILKGKNEYIRFLYDVGIGAKNSQGFGMFEIEDYYPLADK